MRSAGLAARYYGPSFVRPGSPKLKYPDASGYYVAAGLLRTGVMLASLFFR
jgi:hypothetical protein